MKREIVKKILILTLVSIYVLPNICMANVIKEKALTKEISTKCMGHISSVNLDKAFETIKKYVVISEAKLDSAMLQTRAQLD